MKWQPTSPRFNKSDVPNIFTYFRDFLPVLQLSSAQTSKLFLVSTQSVWSELFCTEYKLKQKALY